MSEYKSEWQKAKEREHQEPVQREKSPWEKSFYVRPWVVFVLMLFLVFLVVLMAG